MAVTLRRFCVALVALAAVPGCSASSSPSTANRVASESPASSGVGTTPAETPKCPPPTTALTFTASGHSGNEWVLPVATYGTSVHFTVAQRPGTKASTVWFEIAPAKAPYPGSEVRRFPPFGRDWSPGHHSASVSWDGRDDSGQLVAPGRYHLFADADTVKTTPNPCDPGSTREGYGLGYFEVRR